jgi:hypothetical protein
MQRIDQLRPWQIEAVQALRPARYGLCQAPGGSGKSFVQVLLAQADIEDTGNKQLILVPRTHIHRGFFGDGNLEFVLPGNDRQSRWVVAHNLCEKRPETGKRLRKFLLDDARSLRKDGRLVAISTHHAMAYVWRRLSADERKRATRNLSLRIDEAHHVSNVFHTAEMESYHRRDRQAILDEATRLGNVVRYVLRANEPTAKVHLTTATFFRGDRKTIISKTFRQQFAHYYLPWDEYYETLGIKDLRFDFIAYDKDPVETLLETIRQEPDNHHLVIIPPLTRRYRTIKTHARLLEGLRDIYPRREVLDLVVPETQKRHKSLLYRHPDAFRVVVACRLFDEGTDWVPCNRLHNTDAGEASLTLAVQRFFRPLRRHPDKKDVLIRNYIPRFSPELETNEQRQILSDRFSSVLACVITHGELIPTLFPLRAEGTTGAGKRISLQEAYGDEYHSVVEGLLRGYEAVEDKTDAKAIVQVVETVIEEHGRHEEADPEGLRNAMLSQLVRIACPRNRESSRRTLEPDAIDAETIRRQGFDKVWEKATPIKSALCWGTDNISGQTARELLGALRKIPTLDEIKTAILAYDERTGKRPKCRPGVEFEELGRSACAVDHVCRGHYGVSLTQLVVQALGGRNDRLVERTRELIRDYWVSRGIRLTRRYGVLPEIGTNSEALNQRLRKNHDTTIALEAERILGPATDPFAMEKVRLVIRNYLRRKTRIRPGYGPIPELATTSQELDERLRRSFKVTLDELVADVKKNMKTGYNPLSLTEIHRWIRDFRQVTGERPKFGREDRIRGKSVRAMDGICRRYHGTTLFKEVRSVLGDANDG